MRGILRAIRCAPVSFIAGMRGGVLRPALRLTTHPYASPAPCTPDVAWGSFHSGSDSPWCLGVVALLYPGFQVPRDLGFRASQKWVIQGVGLARARLLLGAYRWKASLSHPAVWGGLMPHGKPQHHLEKTRLIQCVRGRCHV